MRDHDEIQRIPKQPGIYALLGYSAKGAYRIYVGMSSNLQARVTKHLEYRDSSVTTGASAVSLDPDQVSEVECWPHIDFTDKTVLRAAELVAFDFLRPTLTSRGAVHRGAQAMAIRPEFRERIEQLLKEPQRVHFPGIVEYGARVRALERTTAQLVARIEQLESQLRSRG